ncbi:MAG: hypothetical protein K9J17_08530 [Flavobacteriales bacterium]|nr:hypothetical protein [Flavobacteriales bacterium]
MSRVRRLGISKVLSLTKEALTWFVLILAPIGLVVGMVALSERDTLSKKYQKALQDAFEPQYSEVYRHLTQINFNNSNLIWNQDSTKLLVATWTRFPQSFTGSNNDSLLTNWGDTWVTVVPELYNFCNKLNSKTDDELTLRLEQLHGLPSHKWRNPDGTEINPLTHVVEMWVRPKDLFRPCVDSEINDSECRIEMNDSLISADHLKWLTNRNRSSFNQTGMKSKDFLSKINGYPFTRLGYTYDWGNRDTEIGLSEFVIDSGAVVSVLSVQGIREYCR